MYIRRPLQSVERVRVQPTINLLSLVSHPTAMTASSNSAKPSSSRQPGNLGSKATAQAALGDSCLQQPRQDAANLINYLLIGPTGFRHRLPTFWPHS